MLLQSFIPIILALVDIAGIATGIPLIVASSVVLVVSVAVTIIVIAFSIYFKQLR